MTDYQPVKNQSTPAPPASTKHTPKQVRHLTLEESRRRVKVQIWDTAGQVRFCLLSVLFTRVCTHVHPHPTPPPISLPPQERMHVITRTYYKGSHGIALVYNLADPDSFRNVNYWMANIRQHAGDKVRGAFSALFDCFVF